jgi:hypothetical protein
MGKYVLIKKFLSNSRMPNLSLSHCSLDNVTERSFSRLPTHPYVQWWNVTFITINNSHLLQLIASRTNSVHIANREEGSIHYSNESLPLFGILPNQ